ncbi:MAG: RodZ domain-containing protein [Planktomarina sp.]
MNVLFKNDQSAEPVSPKGFDDYEITLGDVLRGERATKGKSFAAVERDLRLKAEHIEAIEACDASVFEAPGFVAGYVRSYAKYLGLDPDWVFSEFCKQSGFVPVSNMNLNTEAKRTKAASAAMPGQVVTPFAAEDTGFLQTVSLGTVVSALALLTLIGGLGYGANQLAQSVQKVALAPVDQTPFVGSQSVNLPSTQSAAIEPVQSGLPRVVALDTPVVTPRDMPIARLNPNQQGVFFTPSLPDIDTQTADDVAAAATVADDIAGPTVTTPAPKQVSLFATSGVWLSVKTQDGTLLFEDILETGQTVDVPLTDQVAYVRRAGNSGALYFRIADQVYGPAGQGTRVAKDIELTQTAIQEGFPLIPAENQTAALQRALDALETRVAAQ